MSDLIVEKNIKIKDKNLLRPITKYEITHLIWNLRDDKIEVMVEYYNNENLVLKKTFQFDGDYEVDVDNLIEKVKLLHG